jgi:hypothetical protein
VSIATFGAVTSDVVANTRGRPLFGVAAEGQPVTTPPLQSLPPSADTPHMPFAPLRSSTCSA